jgi:ABC-2 type transport system ATP-binding protein
LSRTASVDKKTWLVSETVDAIRVDQLRKRYGDVEALDGVGFAVRAGEVFGLLGPNGAGKSTTVKVLATLTTPDAGHAEVAGHDVVREPNAVRRAIGYVPQSSGVDRDATGRENLMLQGRIQGMSGGVLETRVRELLQLLGLAEAADRVVRGYSGGMKRRLDVGLGLVHRPQVLFLDEPTTGLDPEARASMWDELERLAEGESLTILLTTHYMEEADELADRLAIVSRGRVVVEGTPEELKQGLRGEAVEVELGDGRAAEAEAVVGALEGVLESSVDGRRLRSRVASGARSIPSILSALESKGISVEAVTTHRPSLDDVYLHYTGREFAAEDELGRRRDYGEDGRR